MKPVKPVKPQSSPPDDRRLLHWALALAAAWLLLSAVPQATPWLRWERDGLAAGDGWRAFTAHLVHVDLKHAAANAGALLLLWWVFAPEVSPRRAAWSTACIVAVVDLGLWLQPGTAAWYVGGSALLHGWMALGCVAGLRRRDRLALLALAGLLLKVAWENLVAGPSWLAADATVAVSAHLWGTAAGLACGILPLPRGRYTAPPDFQGPP